ncbi:hypothetical protein [Chitinivibrio alkaliphilus]|uniref:HAMP domain-containing protein n=1 Tax=Chitinivibrio alkaliphilus ACht1 TaxID=1313304 RepID=U7D6N9_9BACT|nr:hypothetical protein [Chitinivibrio alkaliphilus]ERP31236.1 hypothetical protein CALK_1853 [Chitinivibrio alkaliphilus ACht1]
MKKQNKRRSYVVYPRIQFPLAGVVIITAGGSFLISALLLSAYFLMHFTPRLVYPINHQLMLLLGMGFCVLLVVISYLLFKFSHRVVGPVIKLQRALHALSENPGAAEPIAFRRKDFFTQTAVSYNQICQYCKERERIRREMRSVIEKINQDKLSVKEGGILLEKLYNTDADLI